MKTRIFVSLGLLLPTLSFSSSELPSAARSNDNHIRSKLETRVTPSRSSQQPAALTEGTYPQAIDHSGALPGQTFSQRYWMDSEYASSSDDAPVIYHICGEGDAEQGYFLDDNAIEWAKALGAHLVYLEHRYYGQSLPFPDLSSEHLRYLTLDNVIEDLASFQEWIAAQQGWKGKWVSVGGSYSGTLSALYRQKHPELVTGALASSAPMVSGVGEFVGTQDDADQLSSTDPSGDTGDRQWAYEACTIFGFWQADGATPGSTLENPSSWLCQQVFGNVSLTNSTSYNASYDLPFISNASGAPSNILFTYGSDDIWTTIGLSEQDNQNSDISILVIQGAGHHFDLNAPDPSDSSAVLAARTEFTTLAKKWLGL